MTDIQGVAVIGGGISGLSCALRLQKLGVPVTLFESEDRVGGLIGTFQQNGEQNGFLFESGPQSFQGTEALMDLIRELSIEGELQTANPRAPRYVLRHGKMQKVPMSPRSIITSSLLSAGSRWKVVSEPFHRTKPPSAEESVATFVRRKFGHEILEYLVSPFVSGVYAGDPEKLSLRAAFPTLEEWEREYGSVIRGAMKSRPKPTNGERKRKPPTLCSFRRGVSTLASAATKKLGVNLQVHTKICAINSSEKNFHIHAERNGQAETHFTRAVVVATPAYVASHLLRSLSAPLAQTLSGIAYAGVAVIAAGYYAKQIGVSLDGFGFLVPRSENMRTLGTVWNSSLFPGRAPEGSATMTSFAGGATDTDILTKSDHEIAALVQAENAKVLQIEGAPVASAVWKHPKALPQYNLGHGYIVSAIRDFEKQNAGLFFSGNYLEGPSLGKCVEHGFKTADAVRDFLAGGNPK